MLRTCDGCDGRGRLMSHEICGHNEREWREIRCYACGGKGRRDLEGEALTRAQAEVESAGTDVAASRAALTAARKRLRAAESALLRLQRKSA
jgi:hypothetical protein